MRQGYLPASAAERVTGHSSSRLHPPSRACSLPVASLAPAPHLLDHLSVHPAPHPAARHHAHKDPAKEGLQAGRGYSMGAHRWMALSCQWRQQAGTTGIPNSPSCCAGTAPPFSTPTPCPAAAAISHLELGGRAAGLHSAAHLHDARLGAQRDAAHHGGRAAKHACGVGDRGTSWEEGSAAAAA